MKLSRYAQVYPHAEDKESVILFSAKRASAVLVPAGLVEDIEKGGLTEEERDTLTGLGLLANSEEEEKQEMLGFIRELNDLDKTLKFTVVLNFDCNLGCKYCFEGARKGKFYLSDETADQFIDFVRRSDWSTKEAINITFYGGEPLLSTDRIAGLSEEISSFAKQKNLKFSFSLVTNGTLLTPDVVGRLAPLGLKSAKVTLDGPKEVHDSFRPFTSGKGSFDVIVRNIKDVCDLTVVQIGGNYTKDHYREFPRLLDHLMDTGITPDKVSLIKFDPVVKENGKSALPDFNDGCSSLDEPWLIDAALYLREEILRRGYRTAGITPSPCIIQMNSSLVVNYDGVLYKCPALIGRKNCSVGELKGGLIDCRTSHSLEAWKNEECLACGYLPLCFGGCKYMLLLSTGGMNGVNCRKRYLDRTLCGFVSQDIKYDL
jgi:uncharacterized protein